MDLKTQVSFATLVRAEPERVYDAFATAEGLDFQQDRLNRSSGWAQALTLLKFYVEHGVTY